MSWIYIEKARGWCSSLRSPARSIHGLILRRRNYSVLGQPCLQLLKSRIPMRDQILVKTKRTNQYNSVCDAGNPDRKSLEKNGLNTFAALSISAYVCPSYSKIGSQPTISSVKLTLDDNTQRVGEEEREKEKKALTLPNVVGPLAGTILPKVLPWKISGSFPGPWEKANVQTASADLSS